jgi:hypothetical protein
MNRTEGRDGGGRKLTTADLAAAGRQPSRESVSGESPDARIERERIERERENARDQRVEADSRIDRQRRAERAEGDQQSASVEARRAEERDRSGAALEQHRAEERTAAREQQRRGESPAVHSEGLPSREREKLEALFPPDVAERYRSEWAAVQSSFVDDPRQAAARGDELVARVLKGLAESFAHEREQLEQELSRSGEASTETLRIGFRRYRSFFERLLAL